MKTQVYTYISNYPVIFSLLQMKEKQKVPTYLSSNLSVYPTTNPQHHVFAQIELVIIKINL